METPKKPPDDLSPEAPPPQGQTEGWLPPHSLPCDCHERGKLSGKVDFGRHNFERLKFKKVQHSC